MVFCIIFIRFGLNHYIHQYFRRILKLDTKRRIQNNEKRLEKKSVDIEIPETAETLQQTSGKMYILF